VVSNDSIEFEDPREMLKAMIQVIEARP